MKEIHIIDHADYSAIVVKDLEAPGAYQFREIDSTISLNLATILTHEYPATQIDDILSEIEKNCHVITEEDFNDSDIIATIRTDGVMIFECPKSYFCLISLIMNSSNNNGTRELLLRELNKSRVIDYNQYVAITTL